jgi:predicted ester cyclase
MGTNDREILHRWFEEVWNKQRREAIAEMLAPEAIFHEAGALTRGPEGFYPFWDRMHASFSAIHVTVHDTIVEHDQLCCRWTCSLRHTGVGLGVPATGKTLEVTGISIVRVAGGMIVEGWQNWDMLGLLEQIHNRPQAPVYVAAI